jgi:hypothetical protein
MVPDEQPDSTGTEMMVDDDENDAFAHPRPRKKQSARKPLPKPIKIVLSSSCSVVEESTTAPQDTYQQLAMNDDSLYLNDLEEIDEELEQEVQDSLKFFQEAHEDQDPSYVAFQASRRRAPKEVGCPRSARPTGPQRN